MSDPTLEQAGINLATALDRPDLLGLMDVVHREIERRKTEGEPMSNVRIHVYDNGERYSDHVFFFVAEDPRLTGEEFDRLMSAWATYEREVDYRSHLRRVAVVEALELAPGLAAYPTQIGQIHSFIFALIHSRPDTAAIEEWHAPNIEAIGEELLLKLADIIEYDEKAKKAGAFPALERLLVGASPEMAENARVRGELPPTPIDEKALLASQVQRLRTALKILDPEALYAFAAEGLDGVERYAKRREARKDDQR